MKDYINAYGYVRVAAASPAVALGDCKKNALEIVDMAKAAYNQGASFVVFPELSITGYTCQDLFLNSGFLRQAEDAVCDMIRELPSNIVCIVGCPVAVEGVLYNCAVVMRNCEVLAVIPKTYLPNYKEFYEKRWFTSGNGIIDKEITFAKCVTTFSTNCIIECNGVNNNQNVNIGVEICEDVWAPISPSSALALNGADIVFNLSGSNDLVGKHQYLCDLLRMHSAKGIMGYVYASCGWGESTSDLVFGGNAIVYENGKLLGKNERFQREGALVVCDIDVDNLRNERILDKTYADASMFNRGISMCRKAVWYNPACCYDLIAHVNGTPFIPSPDKKKNVCDEITSVQAEGLARRMECTHSKKIVVGVSGGLDSTLALLSMCKAVDFIKRPRTDIVGITMPCFGTTKRTKSNSIKLMEALGVTSVEIDITKAVEQHFKDIQQDPDNHDITYENCQARERTQVLMDYGNKVGGFVVGTGDLSELALGWCTYNADHMSMYNVNVSIPKTLVRGLVEYYRDFVYTDSPEMQDILTDILSTPVSPELLPPTADGEIAQVTEDKIGPYVLHDFFLYNTIRKNFSPEKIFYLACHADFGEYSYDNAEIARWLRVFIKRFFAQQFKRNCLPDGPKVGTVSLSPRGDWRMPADAVANGWVNMIYNIE